MHLKEIIQLVLRLAGFLFKHRRVLAPYLFSIDYVHVREEANDFLVAPRSIDLLTLFEVFVDDTYVPRHYRRDEMSFDTVLDIGANIGIFSVWALEHLGARRVVSVEACSHNFGTLVKNTINHRDAITLLHKALYCENGEVGVTLPSKLLATFATISANGKDEIVPSLTLQTLLRECGIVKVDYCKMDIEGAEEYILVDRNRQLFRSRVRYVVMEAHTTATFSPRKAVHYFESLGFDLVVEVVMSPAGCATQRMIYARNPNLLAGNPPNKMRREQGAPHLDG